MQRRKREGVLNMQGAREILRLIPEGHNQSEIATHGYFIVAPKAHTYWEPDGITLQVRF